MKAKIKNENIKQDIIKELEKNLFGNNLEYLGYDSSSQSDSQSGWGIKILTPQQMFVCLPILLAQIQAGNNSRELKNEIRQLLYSLYRSKKITKTIYENLIKIL